MQFEASPVNVCNTQSQKYPTQKGAGRVAEVVEYLHSKLKSLSSNPNIGKKKKKPKKQKNYLRAPIKEKLSLKYRMGLIFPHSATTSLLSLKHDVVGEGN
jgi:hypothetical protein